jgi:hypothetical protein
LRVDLELIEQRGEIDAAPTDIGDAPGRHGRLERVADALMHRFDDLPGARLQIVETEGAGTADQPVYGKRPSRGVDAGNAEMGKDEEVRRRGHGLRHLVRTQLHATHAAGGIHRRAAGRCFGDRSARRRWRAGHGG